MRLAKSPLERFFGEFDSIKSRLRALEVRLSGSYFHTGYKKVIDTTGSLTVTGTYTKLREDSLIVVQASGSGYHNTSATMIGAYVKHDGVIVGDIQVFANTNAVHMAFVSDSMVLNGVSAGSHTLSLEAISPTITDGNDIFKVSVLELPTGTALA